MPSSTLEPERAQVAAAARRLAADGLVTGTAGNVSARSGDLVAVTPTGARLEAITAEDVVVVDLHGQPVAGELAPTSELGLHLGVYRRYQAGAVVHTHAPFATAVACVVSELPVIHYHMLALGGAVRVAPYVTFGTPELAEATLAALDGRAAALMSNHGAISHGPSLEAALAQTELLEWACQLYWRAAAMGTPRVLSDADVAAFVGEVTRRGYGETQRSRP